MLEIRMRASTGKKSNNHKRVFKNVSSSTSQIKTTLYHHSGIIAKFLLAHSFMNRFRSKFLGMNANIIIIKSFLFYEL